MPRPIILIDPLPRTLDVIFDAATRAKLDGLEQLVIHESSQMPEDMVERHLPEAIIIWGQTNLPHERLVRAKKLKAIIMSRLI